MIKSILVVTHYFSTGELQELLSYLKDKVETLTYVEHPFSFSLKTRSSAILYNKGRISRKIGGIRLKAHAFILYLKDFFYTVFFVFQLKHKYDICVAADPLNSLSALFLRKLSFVKKVIYFTVDYNPRRFNNRFLNTLYHQLDKICCSNCNSVWNTTPTIQRQREKRFPKTTIAPQRVVPNGTNFERIVKLPLDKINKYQIVFLGRLWKYTGVELVIEAFPKILSEIPGTKLIIIGTGELEGKLIKRVRDLQLESHVEFRGFIESDEEVEDILSRSGLGVAPYADDPQSQYFYSDPLKPKLYMATGLPVVITKVPAIAWEIDKKSAGIAIDYNVNDLVDAVTRLLSDRELYEKCRRNAIAFAAEFCWNRIFERAFMKEGIDFLGHS